MYNSRESQLVVPVIHLLIQLVVSPTSQLSRLLACLLASQQQQDNDEQGSNHFRLLCSVSLEIAQRIKQRLMRCLFWRFRMMTVSMRSRRQKAAFARVQSMSHPAVQPVDCSLYRSRPVVMGLPSLPVNKCESRIPTATTTSQTTTTTTTPARRRSRHFFVSFRRV